MYKKLAFSIATLFIFILFCEAVVRLGELDRRYYGNPFAEGVWLTQHLMPDPFLQWRGRPGWKLAGTEERLNQQGYRGPDFDKPKDEGTTRIAVLGDSCTFGAIRITKNDWVYLRNYAQILQSMLDEEFGSSRFEVFNYAHLGYSTFHGKRVLRREALDDDPDFVVIRFGWNDLHSTKLGHTFTDPQQHLLESIKYALYGSRLVAMLLYQGAPQFSKKKVYESSPTPIVWVTAENYARNLSRMIEMARDHGAEPILLDAPAGPLTPEIRRLKGFLRLTGYDTFENLLRAHERYQEITARVAKEKGVRFVRTAASARGTGAAAFFDRNDLSHPTAEGHEQIARSLFSEISSGVGHRAGF